VTKSSRLKKEQELDGYERRCPKYSMIRPDMNNSNTPRRMAFKVPRSHQALARSFLDTTMPMHT